MAQRIADAAVREGPCRRLLLHHGSTLGQPLDGQRLSIRSCAARGTKISNLAGDPCLLAGSRTARAAPPNLDVRVEVAGQTKSAYSKP